MAEQTQFTDNFERAVSDFCMLSEGDRVLAAVSGGQDSVALLGLLCEIRPAMDLHIVVAHYNHTIRPDADEDEQFVKELARERGCRVVAARDDVAGYAERHGMNLEAAARKLRYSFLKETAIDSNMDRIAVGHTATDVAETFLMNVLRGAGMHGLASIPPVRGRIIRPLIYLSRQQTESYCHRAGIEYRVDTTNLDTDYRRNQVRLKLLPRLESEYGPGVVDALLRASLAARQELEWTLPLVEQAWEDCRVDMNAPAALGVLEAAELPRGLLVRVLRRMCETAGLDIRKIQWEHYEGIANLIYGESGTGRISLPGDFRARRQYDVLMIEPAREICRNSEDFDIILDVPGNTELPDGTVVQIEERQHTPPEEFPAATAPEAIIDAAVEGPLRARTLQAGDTFAPLGMEGTKKVSDFLIDEKVPAHRRRSVIAIVDAEDRILWLVGHRISQRAAASKTTERVYHLQVQ
ncbi:MAG: tRNA lysidine(34) synthetase TilS [Armatimonadota bacterium]